MTGDWKGKRLVSRKQYQSSCLLDKLEFKFFITNLNQQTEERDYFLLEYDMIMLEIGLEAGKPFLACIILRLQKLSDILQQSSISNTIVSKKYVVLS